MLFFNVVMYSFVCGILSTAVMSDYSVLFVFIF